MLVHYEGLPEILFSLERLCLFKMNLHLFFIFIQSLIIRHCASALEDSNMRVTANGVDNV